ncbi:DHA2 family multidrug resistance protein-like MFS transporter [Neorhizobium huautlense]|uniref:DHA2 family multidrug resistance protein-like MFS transporter n=1 Tax=Neorhizobium huautlense TaxID=67774 RepID=A0ABT9PZ65_9HYPH|nr:MFS transporter [Neorhizobium huautlense]MDP9839775.1 DHA2 family multidrug resistance protein-like MFS transporter [Neorhizobium huautlense]
MPPANRWLVLVAVMMAFLPVVVDMTILHIAVPSLTVALGATGTEVLWIIDIYALVMAGLLVPMGTLADRMGYRRILLIGLLIFGIASIAAAFSTSPTMLIASRAVLGIGASMIMPSVLAVIRTTFEDDDERARALGMWSVVGMAGAAIGPLAGGLLLEHFWWGSVFLVNIPVLAVVIPLVWILVPDTVISETSEWKIGQAVLLVAGLVLSVFAVKAVMKEGLTIAAIGSFVAGPAILALFSRLQVTSNTPMLDLALFAKPAITVGILMAFVASGALAGFELVLAQELQYVLGMSPLEAGLFMLPLVMAAAVGGPLGGYLMKALGLRLVASFSMGGAACALFALASISLMDSNVLTASLMALLGLCLGMGLLASSIAIMGSAPPEKAGAAGALESTGYELGGGIGITMFGVLVNSLYVSSVSKVAGSGREGGGSIGEAMTLAQQIGGAEGEALRDAARMAFNQAHGSVLFITGGMIAFLAGAVFVSLRNTSAGDVASH